RIDIKSVSEAAADALSRLQSEPSMALMAEAEKDNLPLIREILAKKADGRPLTPEEYQALAQFVDRVERRVIERQRAADQESAAKLAEARAGIPAAAFDQPLDVLNLPEHVYNILTEADYRTAGDLLLAMKTAPDRVLSLPGIGPKAMQAIRTAVETVSFPEEEPRPSETVEPVAEASAPMPEPAPEVAVATQPAALDAVVEEEPEAETSFEELFKLRPESFTPASDDEVEKKDKKGKKGKKAFEYEYDEERGEVIGRKKHKRGGDFYEDW
ncbi:MAG: hypothetical protein N2117_14230, partial [Anaerolineales bacterium]|nr:hypothetical protein [Anaerolineales bacterium]